MEAISRCSDEVAIMKDGNKKYGGCADEQCGKEKSIIE